MVTETVTKEQAQAIAFFENKLAFESGPIELNYALKEGKPVQIIDLRTKDLFDQGHIPGAINILYEDLEKNIDQLSKDKTIIVYCYNIVCHLSTKAALALAKKGFNVKELVGGWEKWTTYNLATESATKDTACSTSGGGCH